ncbi:MAG: hypothetical protein N3B16_01605 [Candidatus Aminicenantes bacterium]|nr:hypothetical protein [Candidatus Aminicenantes bacterium]
MCFVGEIYDEPRRCPPTQRLPHDRTRTIARGLASGAVGGSI